MGLARYESPLGVRHKRQSPSEPVFALHVDAGSLTSSFASRIPGPLDVISGPSSSEGFC